MRVCRVPLLLSALLIPALALVAAPDRAAAKGLKTFAAKAAIIGTARAITRNNRHNNTSEAQAAPVDPAFPVQVNAVAEPVVATAPPKPVDPPNSGLVCIAGCYNGSGRSTGTR